MSEAPSVSPDRRLLAILCADVHGYSRLMAENEERTQERVNGSIRLIGSLIGDQGGRIVSVAGDGVMALFENASQALRAAFAIQSALRDGMVDKAGDDPIRFRIGINHGDVFFDEGNAQGHSINVAARIQTLARPGGICITERVHRTAPDSVGYRFRPLGLKYLRNIDEPVEVLAIETDGEETATPLLLPSASGLLQPSRPTVAVEPLQAVSGRHTQTSLALAMTESLVQALSRFDWLAVKERSTGLVAPLLDRAGERIADDQDGYVVSGRIVRLHDSLRLVARLREHPGGRIIWSSGLDLEVGRTFARLDEPTARLAARLDRQIMMAEVSRAWHKPPEGLHAHDYVMRALPLMFSMSKGSLREAELLLRAADEGEPRVSRTRAMRAFAALLRIGQQWVEDPGAAAQEIDWLSRSAVEYAPRDAFALALRGHVESFIFHRYGAALDYFERALQSNPYEPFCWAFSAVSFSYLGRTDEAQNRLHRYRELCPLDPYPFYFNTAFTLTYAIAGEYGKAVEVGRRVLAENPNYFAAYRPLITSLARVGEIDEARGLLDTLLVNEPQFSIGWFRSRYPPLPGDMLEQYLTGFREVGVPDD